MDKKFLSTAETAEKWGISERSVRNYCNDGRVDGAVLIGKIWRIPENAAMFLQAEDGTRKSSVAGVQTCAPQILKGGIYHKVQIELTYNSNHIEGSRLTHDQIGRASCRERV